ncbi:MAG TPA: enoyl-CoA hydratase-related protein [Longimicrobiales bacterium]
MSDRHDETRDETTTDAAPGGGTGWARIRVEQDEGITVINLARPEKKNALDEATIGEIQLALSLLEHLPETRVVVLLADGADFCAGADLSQLEAIASSDDPMANLEDAQALGDLLIAIRRLGCPVVAGVQGKAWAGGAGLSTACDIVLAAENASFAYTEVRLGFVPAMVMTILRRIVGEKLAFELLTTGDAIDARRAAGLGIVNRVLPNDGFQDAVLDFARELAARSPSALRLTKRLFYGTEGLSFEHAIARGAEVNTLARMTPDTRAGVRAFLQSRKKK